MENIPTDINDRDVQFFFFGGPSSIFPPCEPLERSGPCRCARARECDLHGNQSTPLQHPGPGRSKLGSKAVEIWSRVKRKAQCPSSKLEPIVTSFCRITTGPFASCDSTMDCCPYAPGGADPWEGLDGPIPRNSLGGEAALENLGT